MEQLKHFSHEHMLHLVEMQPLHDNKNSDQEDDDDDRDDIVVEKSHFGECKMCGEEIYSFHLCYYTCNDCDYSLHKFCAELPETHENHPLHPDHSLKIYMMSRPQSCGICKLKQQIMVYMYYCFTCGIFMDTICATMSQQKMNHPSHPHQLQRYFGQMMSRCNACGDEHSGTFYHCTTCLFRIHLSCALLPARLSIQQSTNENFSHSHLLTLSYYFPITDLKAKFFPKCRICEKGFNPYESEDKSYLWLYRCDKCRYYVHADCATSIKDAFMSSILMPAGYGKTYKNFKDEDHPNLIHCPLADENVNLLTHHSINKRELVLKKKIDGDMFGHPHPLILLENGSVSLHDPMKKVELLCDGCVRPITKVPFYKCSQHHCDFVLHEWCTMLPPQIPNHPHHPEHPLVFIPKTPENSLGVFYCEICKLPCNGFAYGCMECEYYVDIHCGFIPDVITHEAHPDHLLLRFETSSGDNKRCKACNYQIYGMGFYCPTCDFYLHSYCALLLPRTIRHKYDKHPLSLRYYPAENHSGEYFCEICEDEFDPNIKWFYHCSTCAQSMHTACAPIKLQCERSTVSWIHHSIFLFLNVKFGRRIKLRDHTHPVTIVQGIKDDGQCIKCDRPLQYYVIFKCFECKFAVHVWCVKESIEETSNTNI